MGAVDRFTRAARAAVELPDGWEGYLFESVEGQGVMVTGIVPGPPYSRGPRKGEPNFGKGDKATRRTVFVSNADFDAVTAAALS